jgi:hypothetical protein
MFSLLSVLARPPSANNRSMSLTVPPAQPFNRSTFNRSSASSPKPRTLDTARQLPAAFCQLPFPFDFRHLLA